MLSFLPLTVFTATEQKAQRASIEIITALCDNIVKLIKAKENKENNNPETTKAICVSLIAQMTEAIADIIISVNEKKNARAIIINDEEYEEQLRAEIENFVYDFLSKIN